MTGNYYTILATVRYLASACAGWTIHSPFTQRRNELVIPVGPDASAPAIALIASCEPSANFLVSKQSFSRASKNSADIFPELKGLLIRGIAMHPTDRVVSIQLEDASCLLIRFFGSRSNVLRVDPSGTILDTFLRSRTEDEMTVMPFPAPDERPIIERIRTRSVSGPGTSLEKALRLQLPMLGPVLVRELLFRSSLDGRTLMSDLPEASFRTLERSLTTLLEELTERPSPRIVFQDTEPVSFSLAPLYHLQDTSEEEQSSISKGILRFLSLSRTRDSFLSRKGDIERTLLDELDRANRSLKAVDRAILSDEDIERLEQSGKLIHMHLPSLSKGMTHADVNDSFSGADAVRSIPLDPLLSPARNAQRYFDKAKKARARREESVRRRRGLERTIGLLETAVAEIEGISGHGDLESFLNRHGEALPFAARTIRGSDKTDQRLPFRTYAVDGGFHVWVGKSSANNDLLTTRHTAKNDLWFHARGVGGSHVVLKAGTGKGEISKKAIYEAAAIAAHYSKMKHAKHVAVSMCHGKFVRKPRKAPAGTVVIEREEVLFVDPGLPTGRETR